ncbi:gamma-tubulin complex component 3 [Cryptococcus deuterogattii 99/473]|uniref:Unplaced genomic scaffold supercont1.10, whole genome shotgun sequence n=1 Tax=Cryptococcus deuterogattii Ram5 TaxID=1296110 RepID=A0A0D0TV21_9TREE|nr:gamma-tubulin complex component 3 [Cryptococcus deuterogattii LA55]KIR39763.1 gamma-tubulin complex component 3 [Cryptococcus deuterogattii Ram5]KIR70688.1 gamma-tubulin complex component 3 [Cryptococcus deuterogattii CA1014]KIR90733.1 gamma-tubulin complex component 3 [Cryptococcus deuterogattii CBS 10090]KIR97527.1 gamma-tubulin complex component 3 [Cryptococcus deuterogattii 2001/935-1]KIY57950.1 gamma-tubulin complex component 3 [Cryptococcus deuterogattii 99/473]
MIYASASAGAKEGGAEKALKFSAIWNKLERGVSLAATLDYKSISLSGCQKLLSSPNPHLELLAALSPINPNNTSRSTAAGSSRSSRDMPPPTFSSTKPSSSREPLADSVPNNPPINFDTKGKTKADIINQWRATRSQLPFPQHLLLRDTLYLLQGIDGRYVRFAISPPKEQNPYLTERAREGEGTGFPLGKEGPIIEEGDDDEVDGVISQPTRTLLMQLSEMGMLYRRVTNFINSRQAGDSKGGMIEQSLCHFLLHELSEYHRLLAVLESQMNTTSSNGEQAEGGLTLLRLGLWTEDMKLKLKQMSTIVDEAKNTHGGALVSKLHSHTSNGDPLIRNFTTQILEEVSRPFFLTLQRWIFSGELHDPFKEFFVQINHESVPFREDRVSPTGDVGFEMGMDADGGEEEAYKLWEKKYVFVKKMVPGFVSEDFAKKIFSTGRSLNFIRYSCHDSDWIETQGKLANAGRALKYSDLAGLERSIDDAYSIASQRLLEIFFDKFRLLDHLRALKSYLMLGAGDFTELLMEAMAPRLSKPAISLYRHHLTSDLESAIRGSNAQYDSPDILRRLDARILEYSHGETGWDCFALQYKVEAPLNAVLDHRAMGDYDRLFNHLWRLKRVEVALTQNWMRVTSGSKVYERIPGLNNDWHHCRIVQAEMVHFLRQLQAFCQLEVIECSWADLIEFTSKREGDLDALISAHRKYLNRVVRKVLLLSAKRDKEEILLDLVRDALELILRFKDAMDDLYAWSLAEATRLDRQRDASRGLYTPSTSSDDPTRSEEQLQSIRIRIRECSNSFQHRVVSIVHMAGVHADLDIRFLAIRIAFNGHYSLRKKDKGSSRSTRA